MLIALGFFIACILAMALAPAYRKRADRLAIERVRRSLPVSLEEIAADKDRLRAEHAVEVHRLEARAEEARLTAARQMVEMNRRDAKICGLENDVSRLLNELDEHVNARRVLEHNITERLPQVMSRLEAAHKLLEQRDLQIETLNSGAQKGIRALDEAMVLNAQQRSEIDRLRSTLATRGGPRFADEGSRVETETALRSELEALRARTRDQSSVIGRLQDLLSKYGGDKPTGPAIEGKKLGPSSENGVPDHDVEHLRRDLKEARATLQLARIDAVEAAGQLNVDVSQGELQKLRAVVDEQSTEIKRLSAALEAYESMSAKAGDKQSRNMEGRIAAKARFNALQAQVTSQTEIIKKLRSELVSSNERLARQASQYRDELRRIGAGTRPTTAEIRGASQPARGSSLANRLGQVREGTVVPISPADISSPSSGSEPTKRSDVMRQSAGSPVIDKSASRQLATADHISASDSIPGSSQIVVANSPEKPGKSSAEIPDKPNSRPRLMDRIAGLGRG